MSWHEGNGGPSTTSGTLIPDWKLNPNTQCKITMERLSIPTSNIGFCREFVENVGERCETDSSSAYQTIGPEPGPRSPSVFSTHALYNSLFVLDALLPKILGKDEEKCELCQEYVQKLQNHIIQTHGGKNRHTRDFSIFKSEVCKKIYSKALEFIRHWDTDRILDVEPDSDSENISNRNDALLNPFPCSSDNSSPHIILSNENNDQDQEMISEDTLKSEPISEHMDHFYSIENNLKEEPVDIEMEYQEDPLLIPVSNHDNDFDFDLTESNNISNDQTIELPPPLPVIIIKHRNKVEQVAATTTANYTARLNNKMYECESCGKICRSFKALSKHNNEHTGEKLYTCYICKESFLTPYRLKRHRLTHTGQNQSYKCETCGKSFCNYWILVKHKKTHTRDKSNECEFCHKCFSTTSSLLIHVSEHTGEKIHKCEICKKCYPHKYTLNRHMLEHRAQKRRFKCDMCEKSYVAFDKLAKHRLEHTGVELRFKCETCGKGFHYLSPLLLHKKSHVTPSSYKCGVCGKNVKNLRSLNSHMLTHRGKMHYTCETCGEGFGFSDQLKKHKLIHTTGEKCS